jgi:hypothetical protein
MLNKGGGGETKQSSYKRDVGRKVPRNLPRVDTRVKNAEEGKVQQKILA